MQAEPVVGLERQPGELYETRSPEAAEWPDSASEGNILNGSEPHSGDVSEIMNWRRDRNSGINIEY